jgi:hypothetical protein
LSDRNDCARAKFVEVAVRETVAWVKVIEVGVNIERELFRGLLFHTRVQ